MLQRARHDTTGSKPPEQKSVGTCKRSKVRWNCLGAILSNSTCTAVVPINSTCRITFNITDRLAGFVRLCLELWISYSVSDALEQRDNRWSVWSGASFVMETTEIDGNHDVTSRTAVFQIEIDEENSTTQERSVEDNNFLRTLCCKFYRPSRVSELESWTNLCYDHAPGGLSQFTSTICNIRRQ